MELDYLRFDLNDYSIPPHGRGTDPDFAGFSLDRPHLTKRRRDRTSSPVVGADVVHRFADSTQGGFPLRGQGIHVRDQNLGP
jgi:hypothetical protein